MSKNIDIEELSKEVRREVASKFESEIPNFLQNVNENTSTAEIIGETAKWVMEYSQQYTNTMLKKVLENLE